MCVHFLPSYVLPRSLRIDDDGRDYSLPVRARMGKVPGQGTPVQRILAWQRVGLMWREGRHPFVSRWQRADPRAVAMDLVLAVQLPS
jgi:hypothetical protein